MICTPALDREAAPADAAEAAGERSGLRARFLVWLRRDDLLPQFIRFVLVGGTSSLVYAFLFWVLHGLGSQPANVVAVLLSTVLANDLHWRLTFRAERRLTWLMAQWEGGGVSLIGLVATTLALGWLDSASDPGLFVELGLVGAVFATIGCLRFVALRWLFLLRRTHRA